MNFEDCNQFLFYFSDKHHDKNGDNNGSLPEQIAFTISSRVFIRRFFIILIIIFEMGCQTF